MAWWNSTVSKKTLLSTLLHPLRIEGQINLGLDAGVDQVAVAVAGLVDILNQNAAVEDGRLKQQRPALFILDGLDGFGDADAVQRAPRP